MTELHAGLFMFWKIIIVAKSCPVYKMAVALSKKIMIVDLPS